MPLTCSCDFDWEPEPGQWEIDWHYSEFDFEYDTETYRNQTNQAKEVPNKIKFNFFKYLSPLTQTAQEVPTIIMENTSR